MNDDVSNNSASPWPQVMLAPNDPYISGNAEIPVHQHFPYMSSIHPQQQAQNVSNEWCDPSNNELCDAFFKLNESDQAVLFKDLDEILLEPIPLDELYQGTLEHILTPHDYGTPASSNQSMIQSSPSNFSCSTSSQSSPISSSQSMIQSSPSNNIDSTLQLHELSYIPAPVLDISIQPENTFRFRYKSETKDPHGYLRGASCAVNNVRRNITIDLRLNHVNDIDEKLFVRCTLHQAAFGTSAALIHAALSPHQLQRRSVGKMYDETELFAFRKVTPNLYSFVLDHFLITLTPIDQCQQNCLAKLQALNQHNLALGSDLVLNVAGVDLEASNPGTKKKKKQPLKPIQVQIGFEAFRCINGAYESIAGPIFSNIITHGEPLNIVKICTPCILKDETTENTILVSPLKTLDIKIHLQECGNTANPWRVCIDVNKKMVHNKSAITFQIPRYSGNQQNLANIECSIQMERLCDGARSNIRTFFYTNGLKRCRPGGDATISTITARRARLEDHLTVTPISLKLQPDAVPFTDTTSSRKDFNEISSYPRSKVRTEQEMSTELSIHPFIPSQGCVKVTEQMNDGLEKAGKPNTVLISFLCYIRNLYNKSKNMAVDKKQDYARLVRHYFLDYKRKHPAGNSILHDILADTDLKEYEIVLYKIIEHYELEDIVSQSRNIYGETALMFACMFERPLLMSALINMGTLIAAQDVDRCNNVLHIAMQQSTKECLTSLIQAMKINKNASYFIKALGSYNLRGLTPFHLAVLQNNVPIVAELLQFCKRHNAFEVCQRGQMSDGNTILHLAVLNRFVEMRACILENSGDSLINLINFSGETAEDIILDMDEALETLVDSFGSIQLQKDASS